MKIRVYYEDTDAGGIVYHSQYLNFCERARSEHFFSQGMMPGMGSEYGFVVRNIHADFLGSAKLGDILEVKTTVIESKKISITLLQEIYKGDSLLFKMEVFLVYIERGKPRRIPEDMEKILKSFNKEPIL